MRSLTTSNLLRTLQWRQRTVPLFRPLTAEFRPTTVQVQYAVNKWHWDVGFSQYVGFFPSLSFHQYSTLTPPIADTTQLWQLPELLHSTPKKKERRGCTRHVERREMEENR
jgi:hypothetical protein